jgi:hypothetical protein
MDEFRFTLRLFMIILIAAGIIAGLIGAFLANYALIVTGAILMTVPLILKIINDMILEEWIPAFFEFLWLAAIAFLYIWTSIITSGMAASALDRPILWVVSGVGVVQLLLFIFAFRAQ